MSIFSRFSDIINSNINALLDKAENPEKMVRLIIQEMEDTLVEVRSIAARTLAEKKELTRHFQQIEAEQLEWEQRAALAITKDREDLARAALIEKNHLETQKERLQIEVDKTSEQVERLTSEISQLQEKLTDAKNRQQAILLRERVASSRLTVKKSLDNNLTHALHKFDRFESKIEQIESQADSYDLKQPSLVDEFKALEENSKVEADLEALKASLAINLEVQTAQEPQKESQTTKENELTE